MHALLCILVLEQSVLMIVDTILVLFHVEVEVMLFTMSRESLE